MADKKISQLTAVTLPLTGAEELPTVQSAATKKVTVAQMQAAPIAAQTANCVVYLNGSKVPSTAANLSYNGSTTFTLNGVSSPALYEIYSSSMSGDLARITNDPNNNVGIKLSSDYLDIELAPGAIGGGRNVKMTAANLIVGTAGKGITLTSPDGLTTKLLRLSNLGVLELV